MKKAPWLDRRSFLGSALAVGLASGLHAAPVMTAPARPRLTPEEFKRRLRGPILSVPTPFTGDFKVDYEGLRRMFRRALDYGIEIFELTMGNSQYASLSYEEIKELTRVMAETVGDKGLTIAATGPWWTEWAIDYARYAESVGASAVQVLLPENGDDAGYVKHYQQIAANTRLGIVLNGDFSVELLTRLVQIESIVALKEDITLDYYIDRLIRFGQRLNCFAGGALERFLVGQPYGATAYFDSYSTFAPEITMRFWKAVQTNDIATEREVIEKYDHPFNARWSHPFWRATLERFGIAGRYMRPPQHTYTDQEMKEVKAFYDKLGICPCGRKA